ncbi:MAG: DciA family protein [Gammaproteobacteria bacterium]
MTYSKKTVFRPAMEFNGRSLVFYREKIAEQLRLLDVVRTALPTSIAEHANHCVLTNDRLRIYTASAVWASQIRFFQASILNKLHEFGQEKVTQIQVKVIPPLTEPSNGGRSAYVPSRDTIRAILNSVDEKSEDELKKALAKLGQSLLKRLEN